MLKNAEKQFKKSRKKLKKTSFAQKQNFKLRLR